MLLILLYPLFIRDFRMAQRFDLCIHDAMVVILCFSKNSVDLSRLSNGSNLAMTTDTLPTNPFLNLILPKCNNRYKPRKGLSQPSNYTLP